MCGIVAPSSGGANTFDWRVFNTDTFTACTCTGTSFALNAIPINNACIQGSISVDGVTTFWAAQSSTQLFIPTPTTTTQTQTTDPVLLALSSAAITLSIVSLALGVTIYFKTKQTPAVRDWQKNPQNQAANQAFLVN